VDARWLVPHIEQMLYENPLLTMDYLEAFQATGEPEFEAVARDVLRYVEREMTTPEGLFYSATDADSEGEEGLFFIWTPAQLEAVLGSDLAALASDYWGVSEAGNFEGANILHRPETDEAVAARSGISREVLAERIATARELLYAERKQRIPPHLDNKVLAGWNGLMISAHARAARMLGEERYLQVAQRAMAALLERLRMEDGTLRRSWAAGAARHPAVLEDYAFVVAACLDLFEASWEGRWLDAALALQGQQDRLFRDAAEGTYWLTAAGAEKLLARERPAHDGAVPSGNSVTALNLYRLAAITGEDRWRAQGDGLLKAFAETFAQAPAALAEMLLAVDFRDDDVREVVFVAPDGARAAAAALLEQMARIYLPNAVVVGNGPGTAGLELLQGRVDAAAGGAGAGGVAAGSTVGGGRGAAALAYVCRGGACELPTHDPQVLTRLLREVKPLTQ
jgi:uncharacterized protein YyaL (SSP411 family)